MAARASQRLTACKDYTHMLAIPTITQTSRVHLRSSFAQFEHDTSMLIPEGAVRNPELLDIRIGLLNIPTPEHMEIYTECLLRPDVHKVLRHAAAAVAPLISTNPKEFGRPHICGQTQDIQPLKIDLRGCTTPKLQFNTSFLWAQVIDSTHRLQHFFHSIQKHFKIFSLLHKPFDPKVSIVNSLFTVRLHRCKRIWRAALHPWEPYLNRKPFLLH